MAKMCRASQSESRQRQVFPTTTNNTTTNMNIEEARKLRADDCVLIGGFVLKPASGAEGDDSVLDENGVIELDVPAAWNTRPVYVKPEHIVSRLIKRRKLSAGDRVRLVACKGLIFGTSDLTPHHKEGELGTIIQETDDELADGEEQVIFDVRLDGQQGCFVRVNVVCLELVGAEG